MGVHGRDARPAAARGERAAPPALAPCGGPLARDRAPGGGGSACRSALVSGSSARGAEPVTEALLLEVEGEQVKLNKGREQGVQVGQVYDLYREARVFMLPLTNGEVPLVHTQERVGRVVVSEAEGTTARALVV